MLKAILNDAQKESPKSNHKQLPSHLPKLRMQIVLGRKLWRGSPGKGARAGGIFTGESTLASKGEVNMETYKSIGR